MGGVIRDFRISSPLVFRFLPRRVLQGVTTIPFAPGLLVLTELTEVVTTAGESLLARLDSPRRGPFRGGA